MIQCSTGCGRDSTCPFRNRSRQIHRQHSCDDNILASSVILCKRIQSTCTVCIVEACNTAGIRDRIDDVAQIGASAEVVAAAGHRTGTVFFVHPSDEVRTDIIVTADVIPIRTFLNFVTEGPRDDGGAFRSRLTIKRAAYSEQVIPEV